MAGLARPPSMSDEEFKQCYDVLQKLSDSSRKVIYAFVIIYGALLLWALNSVVYPSEQQRLGMLLRKDKDIVNCLGRMEMRDELDATKCSQSVLGNSLDYLYRKDNGTLTHGDGISKELPAETEATKLELAKLDSNFIEHELQYQLDRSSQVSQFNIPLLGVTSDRSWLWAVNVVLGPLFYFLIRASLENVISMMDRLLEVSAGRLVRLLLLSVLQVISSSPQRVDLHGQTSGTSAATSVLKSLFICSTFSLPILVSILMIYDWYYFVESGDVDFVKGPEFYGGILTCFVGLLEIWLLYNIIILLTKLFRQHHSLRDDLQRLERPLSTTDLLSATRQGTEITPAD